MVLSSWHSQGPFPACAAGTRSLHVHMDFAPRPCKTAILPLVDHRLKLDSTERERLLSYGGMSSEYRKSSLSRWRRFLQCIQAKCCTARRLCVGQPVCAKAGISGHSRPRTAAADGPLALDRTRLDGDRPGRHGQNHAAHYLRTTLTAGRATRQAMVNSRSRRSRQDW